MVLGNYSIVRIHHSVLAYYEFIKMPFWQLCKGSLKYQYLIQKISQYGFVDENHGVLSKDDIVRSCNLVFQNYPVEYCYLFGSYAKGLASETSDVDLLLRTDTTGIKFYGLVERLREALKKNVDVLEVRQLTNNPELINEILRDGVKIYG